MQGDLFDDFEKAMEDLFTKHGFLKTLDTRDQGRIDGWEQLLCFSDGKNELKLSQFLDTFRQYSIIFNGDKIRTIEADQYESSWSAAIDLKGTIEKKIKASR